MTKSYSRDVQILMKILQNQNSIMEAISHFQCNVNNLHQNKMAFDLCAFYMAQIGEDVKLLTDNTRNALTYFDYKMLVYFRNMVDHTYEKINKEVLKAYIFNVIEKKAIDEVKHRIEYCIKASKEEN